MVDHTWSNTREEQNLWLENRSGIVVEVFVLLLPAVLTWRQWPSAAASDTASSGSSSGDTLKLVVVALERSPNVYDKPS